MMNGDSFNEPSFTVSSRSHEGHEGHEDNVLTQDSFVHCVSSMTS
jgi:hypothetical protein